MTSVLLHWPAKVCPGGGHTLAAKFLLETG
jgi:hypothetical protein